MNHIVGDVVQQLISVSYKKRFIQFALILNLCF